MKGYKGYSKGLICKGKQYAENTVFEEDEAVICRSGMHFCENPFDVLDYYPIIGKNGELNEFTDVEALDETFTDDNKKYCTKKLKVGTKIELRDFLKIGGEFIVEKVKKETEGASKNDTVGGDYAQLVGGDYAQLVGGDDAVLVGENGSKAKGRKGSIMLLIERNSKGKIINYKATQVDGEKIKADTWYKLVDGELKEANE